MHSSGVTFDIATFPSGEALISELNNNATDFDLIFLDIFMQELNGMETAKLIRSLNDATSIIFTTASEQYVFAGYEVQALQYLLKPINRQALSAALKVDLKRRFANKYYVCKSAGMTQKVLYEDIEYFESTLKLVKLVAKQGVYEISAKISEVESNLSKLSFCRCHRGFIINFKQVLKMNAQSFTTVRGTVIPVGKTYARATNRAFLNYIGGSDET